MSMTALNMRPRIPLNTREAKQRAMDSCSAWNAHYSPGTRVRVYVIRGEESSAIDTVTTSQAYVSEISARVEVAGRIGGQYLTNVVPQLGHARHPAGESAGVCTLSACLAAVISSELEERSAA